MIKFGQVTAYNEKTGDQSDPGYIKNITVKNVTSTSTSTSIIANEILIKGWNSRKTITYVTFENVVISGEKLDSSDIISFVTNKYVSNITVK